MKIVETWYFDSHKMLEQVTKGKRVFRRNLKKRSTGYQKKIDDKLAEQRGTTSEHSYSMSPEGTSG